jgi:hypothetical protein
MNTLELERMESIEGGGVCGYIGGGGATATAVAAIKYTAWGGVKVAAVAGTVGLIAGGICTLYS